MWQGHTILIFFDFNILEENGNWDFCEGKKPNKKKKIPTKGIKQVEEGGW